MTEPYYNLLDEAWITCELPDGSIEQFSILTNRKDGKFIRGVFECEKEIVRIQGMNPLATAAIHRFLLAILQWLRTPANLAEWGEVWNSSISDSYAVKKLNDVKKRFYLFGTDTPFLQFTSTPKEEKLPGNLVLEIDTENNAVFWNQQSQTGQQMSLPKFAQSLLSQSSFGYAGWCTAPAAGGGALALDGVVTWLEGQTLHDTLRLNLLSQSFLSGFANGKIAPHWTRTYVQNKSILPIAKSSYADYLSRPVRIGWARLADDRLSVISVALQPGELFYQNDQSRPQGFIDPWHALGTMSKREARQPVELKPDRALWRDAHALLTALSEKGVEAPAALRQIRQIALQGLIEASLNVRLRVVGLAKSKAKLFQWRDQTLPIAISLLHEKASISYLTKAIVLSERVNRRYRKVLYGLVNAYYLAATGKTPDIKRRAKRPSEMDVAMEKHSQEHLYWSMLDRHAHWMLIGMGGDDPDMALAEWKKQVRQAALENYKATIAALPDRAARYKADAAAWPKFNSKLNHLIPPEIIENAA